jgi:peroxiredoxin
MPEMQEEIDRRYKDKNIQFVAISTGDPEWYLSAFKARMGVTFPWLLMDIGVGRYNASIYQQYNLRATDGFPSIFILDSDGIIHYRGDGKAGEGREHINYREAFDHIGTVLEAQRQ